MRLTWLIKEKGPNDAERRIIYIYIFFFYPFPKGLVKVVRVVNHVEGASVCLSCFVQYVTSGKEAPKRAESLGFSSFLLENLSLSHNFYELFVTFF